MVHREVLSKSVRLMSVVLARRKSRKDHMRRPSTKKDAPGKQCRTWRKTNIQAQESGQSFVQNFYWSKDNAGTYFNETRGARIRSWFRINEHDEQNRSKLRRRKNSEKVQNTHSGSQVFVHGLNLFVTVQILNDTLAVLSLGKLCEDHGYSYEWINGQEPHLILKGIRIQCNTENFVPIVIPGLSSSSSSSLPYSTSMTPSRQENWSSQVFLKLVYLTNHDIFNCVKRKCG